MTEPVANFTTAVQSPDFLYFRFESWRATGVAQSMDDYVVKVWHRDPKSPTGRSLAASLGDAELARQILIDNQRITGA